MIFSQLLERIGHCSHALHGKMIYDDYSSPSGVVISQGIIPYLPYFP